MGKSLTKEIVKDADEIFDKIVHDLRKMAKHLGEDTEDALSKTAASVAHSAVDLMEDAKTQSRALAEKAGKEVREHPAATAAIVAAVAALIGLAISQRRRPDA